MNLRNIIRKKPRNWEANMQIEKLKGLELLLAIEKEQLEVLKKIEKKVKG